MKLWVSSTNGSCDSDKGKSYHDIDRKTLGAVTTCFFPLCIGGWAASLLGLLTWQLLNCSFKPILNKGQHQETIHIYSKYVITNVQLRLSTPQILSHMYSLDYLRYRFYHACTAWIIYLVDFITIVLLILSTPQTLSHMYSVDCLLHRLYHICTA